jgi:gliding motility-associated-like protein
VFIQKTACDPAAVGVDIQIVNKSNGCDSLIITETTLGAGISGNALAISNFNGYNIACKDGSNGEASVTPLSGTAPFSYQWSNGSSNSIAQNLAAGTYSVTFTDAAGCSGTASVQLDEPIAVQATIDATNPTCQNAGIIEVTQVAGGFGPYTVRLVQDIGVTNGIDPLNFNSLSAGNFDVEISDANGCKTTENVVLLPTQIVNEFVSDTFDLNLGDTIKINAGAGITIAPLDINWSLSGPGQLSCDDCLDPVLTPVSTTLLQLDVKGFGQCAAQGLFLIRVNKEKQVYIPNVINLNSDDNNAFTVYSDERVVQIKSLQIYDRWGTQIVLLENFLPNDPNQGWDGQFRGQAVMPGVYVYWTEVLYRDGTSEIIKGDVTVLR